MKVAELGSHILVPIHDLQGNVAALISDTPAFYRYTAFGEETLTGNPQNPWRFSSKRTDSETGLVNFGRRYYFPSLGRWLTPDPEGFHDGMNLYAYVHNDPLTHFDEYGLVTFDYRFGWVNCPWNSQYSWTRTMPLATHGISIPPSWGTKFPASNDARRAPSFYPLPKLSPHLYVDGMQNSRYDCWLGGRCLSRTFGGQANILPFHTESFGLFRDLFSVYQSKRDPNYSTFSTRRLNKELLANIHSMDALNDPRKLFVTSFSRGAAYLYHGTKEFTPEQRNRLIVTACGPTMILPRSLGFSVTNLVSEADWCSLWCNPGLSNHPERYQSYADVHILSQEGGVFTRGHYFKNRTYQVGIQDYTVPLYRKYGEIK
jgi:RHS repeat-associated protein